MKVMRSATPYISALCFAHAITEASFSMAIIFVHRSDSANAMALPPAPANMSTMVSFDGDVVFAMSDAT